MKAALFLLAICLIALSSLESTEALLRNRRGLTDDADRILRQGHSVDVNNVGQLIDLVERNRANECLARVICELASSPGVHGESGSQFGNSLMKFRQSRLPKVKYYVDAMNHGVATKNHELCKSHYPRCNHPTAEVIAVGNRLLTRH